MKDIESKALGYVVITDYLEANTGKDVSGAIQKVIDENPMRTIFFPDGEYILANPICTSAKPENAVALQLSNFAILKAADGWVHEEAMVRLGAAEPYNTIYRNGSNYYFCGGIVDGNMVATGISIESGRETSVRNVSIKHTKVGLHIKYGANSGSSDADIETVHIVGNNKKDSIGVLVEGYDNTFTNMRIAAVQTGFVLKSSGNFLRNIHPLFIFDSDPDKNEIEYADSVAFWDLKSTNWFDYCYSDQMATGFKLTSESKSVFMNCFAMWYTNRGNMEVGFCVDGQFNATVTNPKIHFRNDTDRNVFLTATEEGGVGLIENPIVDDSLIHDDTYKKYLTGRVVRI